MSYTETDLQEVINRLKNNADPNDFPPALLFMAQYHFYNEKNMAMVNKIGAVARQRLLDKGLVRCGFLGWYKREDIGRAGIVFKNNVWQIEDGVAFKRWCDNRFKTYNSAPPPPEQTAFT